MSKEDTRLDAIIVGAGPAGLTAATYLARYRRRIAVIDAGHSRARWIPESHNCPGFPSGVSGTSLLHKLHEQAEQYGVRIECDRVVALRREPGGFQAVDNGGASWRSRFVILATGILDKMPVMEAIEEAVASGALRLCAVCDGYEASDERIAVYGPMEEAIGHAVFLRTFSRRVSVLPTESTPPAVQGAARAREAGISILPRPRTLRYLAGTGCSVEFSGPAAANQIFDTLYPVLGSESQSVLAIALGANADATAQLIVDADLQTSVDGLYAIGDVVSALNQISVAVGHAAIAASAIHSRLPTNFREDAASPAAHAP